MSAAELNEQLSLFETAFVVCPLTAAVVQEAVRGTGAYNLSYYDAQIWAAAQLNDVPVVRSEDFNVGGALGGVSFLNPFEPSFDLSEL